MPANQKHACSLAIDNDGASCSGPFYPLQPIPTVDCPDGPISPTDSDLDQQEYPFQPPHLHGQVKMHKYEVSIVNAV